MAATDMERLVVRLEAQMKSYENEMRRARTVTDNQTKAIESRFAGMNTRIEKMMSTSASAITAGLSRLGGVIGAALSINSLKQYADAWTEAGNKIAAAGESGALTAVRQRELADLAIRTRSELGATVDLYTGLMRATQGLGKSQAEVAQVTETINKAFVVGGQSTATAAGAITQLNQAFQSGKLSGDELNSVLEGAPPLARLIAKEFGVTVGQLKKLAEEGKLTSDAVFRAIQNGSAQIAAEFARTNPTIAQSFQNLQTAMTRYVGQADQAQGASARIAAAIQGMANNIDVVAPLAATLGAALLAFSVGGPVAAGVAALATAFYLLGDTIQPIAGDIATLSDYAVVAFQTVQGVSSEAATMMQQAFATAADAITGILSGIGSDGGDAFNILVQVVKNTLNLVIGAFVFAKETILATWNTLGFAMAESMINAMNAVVRAIEGGINAVVTAINSVTSKIPGADLSLGTVNLGEIENGYRGAGAAAGKAFGEAFGALSRDYIGGTVSSVQGAVQSLRDQANLRAQDRAEQARRNNQAGYSAAGAANAARTAGAGAGGAGGGEKEKLNAYEREILQIERRTRALDAERQTIGQSAIEVAKAEAAFRLMEAAKRAGLEVTPKLTDQVNQLANAYATAKVKLEDAEQAQRDFEQMSRDIGSALNDAFQSAILQGEKLSDVLRNLANRLASMAIDSAFQNLFSPKSGDGLLGGLLKAIGLGARASGGPVQSGQTYLVGENGPELVQFGRNGTVTPNSALPRGGSGGGNMQVIINNNAGAQVSTRQTQGPQGPRLEVQVEQMIGGMIANGGLDKALKGRFGVSPMGGR